MTEQQIFEIMRNASPIFLIVAFLVLLVYRLPGILDNWGDLQDKIADKERQRVQGLESVQAGAMDAVRLAVDSMKQAQAESRTFYIDKMETMRSSLSLVEGRVRDLENQIEDKDRRIKEQEARIRELERENEELRNRADELERKLNAKEARKAKNEKGFPATVPAAGD